jgi:hypothetical protein
MDFPLSFLDKGEIDAALILKLMVAEVLIGALIGVGKKALARLQAITTPSKRAFSARDYTSTFFGTNLPRGSFNLLALAPSLVVVDYDGDQVRRETFYSPLGDHVSFVDGKPTLIGTSILSSPTYLSMIVLPMVLGFLGSLLLFWLSPVNKYAPSYLMSGLAWVMITPWIPILIYRTWEDNTPSE